MPYTNCNDITVYYEIYGSGEPLVLISGLGGDHTFWQASIPVFSVHYQLIIFDTRGIGKTDAPHQRYSIDQFVDDLKALLDALHIKQVNLLGFSMGGNIALAFALKYSGRIKKLIIAASCATLTRQTRLFIDAVLSVYESGATTKQMFDLICPWLFSDTFLKNESNTQFLHYDEADPNPQPLYAWKNQYLAQREFNTVEAISRLKVPTLIVGAAKDRLAHKEDSELLHNRIEHSKLEIIPESGHLMNYEKPDLFHKLVLSFLGKEMSC